MTKSDRLAFRATPELRKALADRALSEGRTVSSIIQRAVTKYLDHPKPTQGNTK